MLEKQLHKLGLERARVTAVATKAGKGAEVDPNVRTTEAGS